MQLKKWLLAIGLIALPILLGSAVGIAFAPGDWYDDINKPFFNPPSWLFGPVWTVIYAMMGYASFRVVQMKDESKVVCALVLYGVQLLVNLTFTPAFFGLQNFVLAAVICTVLIGLVIWTIREFYIIDKIAGLLLVPYLLWCLFASALAWSIAYLN